MGETRVDLLHLLQDLADAYPGDMHETILIEIVANALDSGAGRIRVSADAAAQTVTVIDDGAGMRRADLRRFHDVATSTKSRGDGIGFAGVGIKLGLLVSDEVITESKRGTDHISTSWTLANRKRAPWRWVPPLGMISERGTAVRLRLNNPLSPLVEAGFLENALRTHFEPLFDPQFDDVLRPHYPNGIQFEVNGQLLARSAASAVQIAPIAVRLAGKRKASAVGYVLRGAAVDEDRRGVAISTFGKVIKRGWDWLGMMPAAAERTSGLIEAPGLAGALTLNKADFLRTGSRGAVFLAYRKALQEAVGNQLAKWGDADPGEPAQHRRVARPIERDMESVLADLAESFPLLAMLVQRRAGGNRKLPGGRASGDVALETMDMFAAPAAAVEEHAESSDAPAHDVAGAGDVPPADDHQSPERTASDVTLPSTRGPRRATRLGLSIQFESRPDEMDLSRLLDTTIWVNDAHPAYRRAVTSRSEGYHVAVAVAMALAKVAVDPVQEREFVLEFLARWGEAKVGGPARPRRRAKRAR